MIMEIIELSERWARLSPGEQAAARAAIEGTEETDIEQAETRAVESADYVWARLSELYEAYYRQDSDIVRWRMDVEVTLSRLMLAYNAWLG